MESLDKTKRKTHTSNEVKRRYYDKTMKQFKIDLNKNTDADIIAKLESVPNKAGYVKQLIRADINK